MNEEIEALKLELYDSYISDIGITQKTYKRLNDLLNLIEKQQKEIEEKSTIMAGAEKVKQLEKEIKDYKIKYMYLESDYNFLQIKIREKIKEIDGKGTFDAKIVLEDLLEEE